MLLERCRKFSHESKVRNLNDLSYASFEWQYFGPCVHKLRNSHDWPEVFSSDASLKPRSEIVVWMPWSLNWDLGAELRDLLTTSADKLRIF